MQAAMAGLSIGGKLLGGLMGKSAGNAAAGTIGDAVKSGNDLWAKENAANTAMNQPYLDLGAGSAGTLSYLLGTGKNDPNLAGGTGGTYGSLMNMGDFKASPDYTFRLQQGMQALQRSAAARGNLVSGGTIKANDEFASNLASGEYGNWFQRELADRASKFGMLSDTTRLGQHSADTMTNANDQYAGNVADNTLKGAFGQADAKLMGDASLSSGIQGGLTGLMQYLLQRQQAGQASPAPSSQAPY